MMTSRDNETPLIDAMLQPDFYAYPVERCELIETHISWVILTGQYAYKIKKPVDFGFLDFSTLEKRHFCCQEELRLNGRSSGKLYLDVVPITREHDQFMLEGTGETVEYAVKMFQFPQQVQFDRLLDNGELQAWHIDQTAQMIARFHQQIAVSEQQSKFGTAEAVNDPVLENFMQIREHSIDEHSLEILSQVEQWSQSSYAQLKDEFTQRKSAGYIRECHGDMHLANLAWVDDEPVIFDCIEFNPNLRWIDVMNDVAFLVMDLQQRKQPLLAWRFLNRYLEYSGDYAGLKVLRFYLCYRAMVRAKIAILRLQQPGIEAQQKDAISREFTAYLQLALSYTHTEPPKLIITRGVSASGKSTVSQQLLESLPAVRIRSDVERKRIAGLWPEGIAENQPEEDIYRAEFSLQTYDILLQQAAMIMAAGYTAIVDAAFLKPQQRQLFQQLAQQKHTAFIILEFTALAATLRQRIQARKADISDADLMVLEQQLEHYQPLTDKEFTMAVEINTEKPFNSDKVIDAINKIALQG